MTDLPYWTVPRCWPGETVAILAGGLSLTQDDVDHVLGRCPVIAINRSFEIAPDATWLYGCDVERFWAWFPAAHDFAGLRIGVRPHRAVSGEDHQRLVAFVEGGGRLLRHSAREVTGVAQHEGASSDPAVVRGNNSLFQILSVIAHTGAARVLLMGADMRGGHWHGGYAGRGEPDYAINVIPPFGTLARPLEAAGVEVVNCSPGSRLPYFGRPVDVRDVI